MLIDFFYTLRAAKLPVSVREYLTLLEALQANVVGPASDACSIDDFYHLVRTVMVKDEKHFDKFDKAFGAYFKGVEMLTDFTKEVPLDWLEKILQKELTPEQKAAIEKMGWDELMDTLKKRLEEQKERHEGGNKWIGTGGCRRVVPTPSLHCGYRLCRQCECLAGCGHRYQKARCRRCRSTCCRLRAALFVSRRWAGMS